MSTRPKAAIVTGAGTGIGRAVAIGLLEDGYCVVLAGRPRSCWNRRSRPQARRACARIVPTDARDPAAVRALFAATRDMFGRLDLLFNNAGVTTRGVPIGELTLDLRTPAG